jgi:hypothetical protein
MPSPALVISAIALVFAVGGGTFALAISGSKTKTIAKKVANKQISKRAPDLSVKTASVANSIGTVSYVKGNEVVAPKSSAAGPGESTASVATCPTGTVILGDGATSQAGGIEVNDLSVHTNGSPAPNEVTVLFDNFGNTDIAGNFATAICAAANSVNNPGALKAGNTATR